MMPPMTLPERAARAMLHELHVGRFCGHEGRTDQMSRNYQMLAAMSEDETWRAVNEETRQTWLACADVAARVFGR